MNRCRRTSIWPYEVIVYLGIVLAPCLAHAASIADISNVAKASTLAIDVRAVSCVTGLAERRSGSGIYFAANGLVVTAAHLVGGDNCIDSSLSISGMLNKATSADPSDAQRTYELALVHADLVTDVAVLVLQSELSQPLPKSRPVCSSYSPKSGETLYGFGFPFGKPLTPLNLTYSSYDVEEDKWIVSGLTIDGMSGGPVLDKYGNLVGLIHGGSSVLSPVNSEREVYALRSVTPIRSAIEAAGSTLVDDNCGPQKVPVLDTEPDASWFGPDGTHCDLTVPHGFEVTRTRGNGVTLHMDMAPTDTNSGGESVLSGLADSGFSIRFERAAIKQPGMGVNFDQEKDVLACAAAVGVYAAAAKDQSINMIDNLRLGAISAISRGKAATAWGNSAACYAESAWPVVFLDGRVAEASTDIFFEKFQTPYPYDDPDSTMTISTEKMRFARTEGGYIGSFEIFDRDLYVRAQAGDWRKLMGLMDSHEDKDLSGLRASCRANDIISFESFKSACGAVVQRAIRPAGNRSGTCLANLRISDP